MTLEQIQEYIQSIGERVQMFGFTSTSLDKNQATGFAWANEESGHHKVIFHYKWNKKIQHYFLDAGAYDDEKEILLMDGVDLYVHSVEDIKNEYEIKMYTLIVLGTYPSDITLEEIKTWKEQDPNLC